MNRVKDLKSYILHLILLIMCGNTLSVQASLNIEITQGVASAVPIGVMAENTYMPGGFEQIAQVIRDDLRHSGRFSPLSPGQMPSIKQASQYPTAAWQDLGLENVLLGDVQKHGHDNYSVSFKLLDTYNNNAILVTQKYNNISAQSFRALAHHISDVIFEHLTGIKGVFSTRIAYVMVLKDNVGQKYQLEVSDMDGHNPRNLVRSPEPIMSPSWSPDGSKLAYVSFEDHRAAIYVVDIISGQRKLLSRFPGINGAPAWSPDGNKMAIVLSKDGSPKLYIMDLRDQSLTRITEGYAIDTEPTWHRNGKELFFTSNRGGKPQIYKINLATKKVDRVTFKGSYNARPMLTSDGKHLVTIHRYANEEYQIASFDLRTGDVELLTRSGMDESPTLSPNGAMVLYGTSVGKKRVLGMVTVDGSARFRLPAREGDVQEPAWSPFLS